MHAPPHPELPRTDPGKNGCHGPENCQPAWAKLSLIICVVCRTWPDLMCTVTMALCLWGLRWSPRCHNLPSSSPAVVSSRHPPIVVLFTIRFCSSNNEVNNLVVIAIREVVGTKMENFHDYIGILQGLQHPAFWLATCDMKFLLMYAWLMYHLQVTHQLPLRITGPLWRESRSN